MGSDRGFRNQNLRLAGVLMNERISEFGDVQPKFWIGERVAHKCKSEGEPDSGMVTKVTFSEAGVEYLVKWSIAHTDVHDEIELESAL